MEYYFGQMKKLWQMTKACYTWKKEDYNLFNRLSVCFTNFHIIHHPLRKKTGKLAEDGKR